MYIRFVCAAVGVVLSAITIPAHADPILAAAYAEVDLAPNGTLTIQSYSGLPAGQNFVSYSLPSANGAVLGAVRGGSDPEVISSVHSGGSASGYSESDVYLWYEFAVNGPTNETVPVTVAGTGNITGSGFSFLGVAQPTDASSPVPGNNLAVFVNEYTSPGVNSFNVDQTFDVLTGTVYVVELDADVFVSGAAAGAGSATVDPTITLGTSDPAYSLEFSPGLLGATPTPEPPCLLLVGTGLGLPLFLARRKSHLA